jgi:hypothetical protein
MSMQKIAFELEMEIEEWNVLLGGLQQLERDREQEASIMKDDCTKAAVSAKREAIILSKLREQIARKGSRSRASGTEVLF